MKGKRLQQRCKAEAMEKAAVMTKAMKAASSDSDGDGDMFAVQLEDRQIEEEENRTISLRHKMQPYIHASCIRRDP